MKRRSLTRLKPIYSLEKFLKKYPSLFGILIPTLISAIALIMSLQANNATRKQTELEKIPLIDHELIYGDDQTALRQVKFVSLKPNIKIESLQVITPSDFPSWISMQSNDNTWRTGEIGTYLSSLFSSYYCDPSVKNDLFATASVPASYPIAIKFNYVVDGNLKEINALYTLNIVVYSMRKCKVESLTFIRYFDADQDVTTMLDFLNNTEYLKKRVFRKTSIN